MNQDKLEIYNEIRKALHEKWDPIGVYEHSEEMGEYDSYVPALYQLLIDGGTKEEVFSYLVTAEEESMGLECDKNLTSEFSGWLVDQMRR